MLQPALLFSAIQWSVVMSPASNCMPQEYLGNRSLAPSRHQLALRSLPEGPDIVGPLWFFSLVGAKQQRFCLFQRFLLPDSSCNISLSILAGTVSPVSFSVAVMSGLA